MNTFYQTHLTDNSIKNICRRFYERYADPLTQTVTSARAVELLQHIYECLGLELSHNAQDGQQFVTLFATQPAQGITYIDFEKHFLRYLAGPAPPTESRCENLIDRSLKYEQREKLEREIEEARERVGTSLVGLQLRTGRQQFFKADADRDGFLTAFEARGLVRALLGENNNQLRDEEIDGLVEQMDADKDGRLSHFDFDVHLLRSL